MADEEDEEDEGGRPARRLRGSGGGTRQRLTRGFDTLNTRVGELALSQEALRADVASLLALLTRERADGGSNDGVGADGVGTKADGAPRSHSQPHPSHSQAAGAPPSASPPAAQRPRQVSRSGLSLQDMGQLVVSGYGRADLRA